MHSLLQSAASTKLPPLIPRRSIDSDHSVASPIFLYQKVIPAGDLSPYTTPAAYPKILACTATTIPGERRMMSEPKVSDILVVDDSPLLRKALQELLKDCGFSVRTAPDGYAALLAMRARLPDLLLSDLQMTGMSGFELLSIVRHSFPSVLAIAMSGAFPGTDIPSGVAADAFYPKGACSLARLIEIVTGLTERRDMLTSDEAVPDSIPRLPEGVLHRHVLE